MKTRFFFAALLLLAFGTAKAQFQAPAEGGKNVNTVVVSASGDVTIGQADQYVVTWDAEREWHANYNLADTSVYLDGTADFFVTLQELNHLTLLSSGDVKSTGVLKGKNLTVELLGSGDVTLNLDYDNVSVLILGSGDVELRGKCNTLVTQGSGSGDLNIQHLQYGDKREKKPNAPDMAELDELMRELNTNMQQIYDSVDWEKFERDMEEWGEEMEEWGRKMEKWGERFERKHGKDFEYHYEYKNTPSGCGTADQANKPSKRSLLLNPHWQGFDAGLNMLLDPTAMDVYTGDNGYMETRPLRSWYFGFNIADVGIAFDRNKRVGMYTGVGLGWNNYSWKNYIQMTVDGGELVNTLIPDDRVVKNSKMGVLYLQVPLMLQVRPTRHMYVDLGVTGGVRLAAWTRIKYADGQNVKSYSGYLTNLLKCDASLRVGSENLGFFVNYALVPMFTKGRDANKAHPVSLGFSINF